MSGVYNLSPEQRATWIELRPAPHHRLQAKIAEDLERNRQGKASSWRTQLSAFFKGKEKGLKSVFEFPARLQIVGRHLGATPAQLRKWLDIATGTPTQGEPGMVRVPGFEDYGPLPVEKVYFPPKQRETRFHLPKHGQVFSSGGGQLDLDKLLAAATAMTEPPTPKAIVLAGGRGSGRTPSLEAIGNRLNSGEQDVVRWEAGLPELEPGGFLLIDNFDELDHPERTSALELVQEYGGALLCAVGLTDQLQDLPSERIIVELVEGDEHWAMAYLTHLSGKVADALARRIDIAPLQEWLSNEPDATAFLNSADILGLVARHVADGGTVPLSTDQLLSLVTKRWAHQLRRNAMGAEALTVELCLPEALAQLAHSACTRGGWSHTIEDVVSALVEVAAIRLAAKNKDVWLDTGGPGILAVVEALVEQGFFMRREQLLEPAQQVLQAAALGRELFRDPDDTVALERAIVDQRWHEGVLVAAKLANDLAPMLRAIEALPLGPRVHCYTLVTRLLASPIRCSEQALMERWFRRCLLWWASTPPEQRSVTMTIGSGSAPRPSPQTEALIGGSSPLLVLGRASRSRRTNLQGPDSVEDLRKGEGLPTDEERYLELLRRRATRDSLHDALVLGAPFQCDLVIEPDSWSGFPSMSVRGHELPGGLTREEYEVWWRTVGAPRLLDEDSGISMIAGTKPGWSVEWSMSQRDQIGTKIWSGALAQEIEGKAERGPTALAEAVAYVMQVGGLANFEGVRSVWKQVKGSRRLAVCMAVKEVLPPPESWFLHDTFITWVLREFFTRDELVQCWTTWTSETGQTLSRIPWKIFLEAGLPDSVALTWALETMPEEPSETGEAATPIPSSNGNMMAFQLHEPRNAPQAAVLDHYALSSDPELLEALLAAPAKWSQKAWPRLGEVAPKRQRILRLQAAAGTDSRRIRADLVHGLHPQAGELELWQTLAQTSTNWHEALTRWVQAAASAEGDDRWSAAVETVTVLEALTGTTEEASKAIGDLFAMDEDAESPEHAKESAKGLVEELHGTVHELLHELGNVLVMAPDADTGLEKLVRRVFDGPLRPLVRHHQGLWALAWRVGGYGYVSKLLVSGHADDESGEATLQRLDACVNIGLFEKVVGELLLHETLGRSATLVFANRISPQHPDLMRRALVGQPVVNSEGQPDAPTVALVRKLASADAMSAVEWVKQVLAEADADLARLWWEALTPAISPGPARVIAVTCWDRVLASAR